MAAFASLGLQAAAQTLEVVSGDKQSVRRAGEEVPGGIARFEPLRVSLKDAGGKPMARATIEFTCAAKPATMVCQLESYDPLSKSAPATAQLTPSGWATSQGQVVALVEGAASAKAGAASILKAVPQPPKAAGVRVATDENGIATLDRLRGKSVWAYGAAGDIGIKATHAGASADFTLKVTR